MTAVSDCFCAANVYVRIFADRTNLFYVSDQQNQQPLYMQLVSVTSTALEMTHALIWWRSVFPDMAVDLHRPFHLAWKITWIFVMVTYVDDTAKDEGYFIDTNFLWCVSGIYVCMLYAFMTSGHVPYVISIEAFTWPWGYPAGGPSVATFLCGFSATFQAFHTKYLQDFTILYQFWDPVLISRSQCCLKDNKLKSPQ